MRNSDNPLVVLRASSYIVAAEVFLRMTDGLIFYETGKYSVILFVAFGLYYHNFKKSANIFVVFLLLLIPGIVVTYLNIGYEIDFRKNILFNISGELCLFAVALFCYNRDAKLNEYLRILDIMVLPIISLTAYLFFYTPDLQEVVTGAEANFAASGGFGPNQVATVLGLGMFCIFVRLFLPYQNKILRLVMYVMLGLITFRALATLSRGGVFTAIIMSFVFMLSFLRYAKPKVRYNALLKILIIVLGSLSVWSLTLIATNEMVYNKYTNRNANGLKQDDFTTGRVEILEGELQLFSENPFFGIGTGLGKFIRDEITGRRAASHNEITRLISEHGFFGIVSIILLMLIPVAHFFKDRRNIFIIPLVLFWLLTISHSAMRIAAPGLLYGLALLKIRFKKTD
jgi:O-antigen ligase